MPMSINFNIIVVLIFIIFINILNDFSRVHHLCIEDIIEANGEIRFILEKTAAVKLQLIVICPDFLDQIAKNLNKMSCLSKLLYPNRILALLLGVTDNDIVDIHKNGIA